MTFSLPGVFEAWWRWHLPILDPFVFAHADSFSPWMLADRKFSSWWAHICFWLLRGPSSRPKSNIKVRRCLQVDTYMVPLGTAPASCICLRTCLWSYSLWAFSVAVPQMKLVTLWWPPRACANQGWMAAEAALPLKSATWPRCPPLIGTRLTRMTATSALPQQLPTLRRY